MARSVFEVEKQLCAVRTQLDDVTGQALRCCLLPTIYADFLPKLLPDLVRTRCPFVQLL
ncbi:hypothetical protein ACLOJK_029469 [Asimina triloba]